MRTMLFLAALAITTAATANVPEDLPQTPEMREWFARQENMQGMNCCNMADSHVIEDTEWKMGDDLFYYVRIFGQWRKIYPGYMRNVNTGGPNIVGKAIVWHNNMDGEAFHIYCFAPGTMY